MDMRMRRLQGIPNPQYMDTFISAKSLCLTSNMPLTIQPVVNNQVSDNKFAVFYFAASDFKVSVIFE